MFWPVMFQTRVWHRNDCRCGVLRSAAHTLRVEATPNNIPCEIDSDLRNGWPGSVSLPFRTSAGWGFWIDCYTLGKRKRKVRQAF